MKVHEQREEEEGSVHTCRETEWLEFCSACMDVSNRWRERARERGEREEQVESGERARGNSSGFHFPPWMCEVSRNESYITSSYTLPRLLGPTPPHHFHLLFFFVQCKIFFLF